MLRALGIAVGMLASSAAVQAGSWTFTLSDLCRTTPGFPDLCIDVHGGFTGSDTNADGIISLAELTSLHAETFVFYPSSSGEFAGGRSAPKVAKIEDLDRREAGTDG